MADIGDIPLETITAFSGCRLIAEPDSVVLVTDRQQWAYGAQAKFEIPGIEGGSRMIAVDLEVEAGVLGIGWLTADGQNWITRTSAGADVIATEVRLVIPVGTIGGKLVFDNWTAGGEPARGRIRKIKILEVPDGEADFLAGMAREEGGDTEGAILLYKTALRIDPSHVGSIAALGRLRFVPPKQPLLDELKRRAPVDVCEVIIAVRNPCNYRCFYCVAAGSNAEPVKRFDLNEIAKTYITIQRRMQSKLIVTSFDCGGGEPTVHPEFGKLLELCAQYGAVSFPTNNSQNPDRWFPKYLGSRLLIRAALHPEGEERLTQFLQYARYLIEAGCDFHCVFVAHPTRMQQIEIYTDTFANNRVPFVALPFIGTFNSQPYPYSYTEKELQLLQYSNTRAVRKMIPDHIIKSNAHVNRIRNFRGIPCLAGFRYFYIRQDGRMQRCPYDWQTLDAPLSAAAPCKVKSCGCGLVLDNLNFSQTPDFYNLFAEKAGLHTVPVDWKEAVARSLRYEDAETGLVAEYTAMYDALMSAYGKDEFPE